MIPDDWWEVVNWYELMNGELGGRLSGPEQELTDGHLPTDLEF